MMRTNHSLFIFLFFTLGIAASAGYVNAQEEGLDKGTISSQFDYVKNVSTNYQDYKVVKRAHLDRLESNINDSINSFHRQVAELKSQIDTQRSSIDQLNQQISETNQQLSDAVEQRDSFSIFGVYLHKALYNNLMWGIVILLATALVVSYFRFRRSHVVTAETKKRLEEIQEEYEQHRKNTLERERKLNRQLVDALNKR
jgi:septal ring factor EnvC (AmiA/AmiB activator)